MEKIIEQNTNGHFMGTIVYVLSKINPLFEEYMIIDGQQRITTTILFLKAIYDELDENILREKELREDIWESYFYNKRVEEKYKLKLKPIEDDRIEFTKLLDGEELADSKIHENYKLLQSRIRKSRQTVSEIYSALSLIQVVYIQLNQNNSEENPQIIFESINSTGLSLTQADLIRNFMLMSLPYEEQKEMYKSYWLQIEKIIPNSKISDFVRDYLTMKTGNVSNKGKVYDSFKIFYSQSKMNQIQMFKDLLYYARIYQVLINANHIDEQINEKIEVISQLNSTVVYPFLLQLFADFKQERISKEKLLNALDIIISYLIRRLICSVPTNALNKVFSIMGKSIREKVDNGMNYVEAISEYLMTKTGSNEFPKDERVIESLKELRLYGRNNNLVRLLLISIEKNLHKEFLDFDILTIEHILPQVLTTEWKLALGNNASELHEQYKDTLGNLTLTNYNGEMSNSNFDEKRKYYIQSNIKMNRNLADYNEWNIKTIKNRTEYLSKQIIKIWKLPEGTYNKVSGPKTNIVYSIIENIDVTGFKPKFIKIENSHIMVNSWKEFLIQFCKYLIDIDENLFESLVVNNNFRKLIFVDDKQGRVLEKIKSRYFIETNFNANTILNYCALLSQVYEIDDIVEFSLKKNGSMN